MYRISMPHVCRVEWVKPMTSTNGKPTVLPMRSLESAASLLDQAPSDADAPATYAADSPLQMAGGRILKRLGGMGDAVSGLCPGGEPGRHNAA